MGTAKQIGDTCRVIDSAIEQQAQILLERHRIVRPPVPVGQLALAESVQVLRSRSAGEESGFLLRDRGRTIIGVNSKNSDRRQRFTIAHSLGHWQLHAGRPLTVDHLVRLGNRKEVSSSATDREEMEANAFAAALLMPGALTEATVQRELSHGVKTIEQLTKLLADEFDVSAAAVSCRLVSLGIITCP
jgi:Zn-dependent peptidase ImmA (M78 family)